MPLMLRQMQSSKRMTRLQPRIQEIQKKHSDPKRRTAEMQKLYKEEGVNPLGCLAPTLIQFPIWIALYQVIRITLGTTLNGQTQKLPPLTVSLRVGTE